MRVDVLCACLLPAGVGVGKGKGTATLGSGRVEWSAWAGHPLSDVQEGPVPSQRGGGLWSSRRALLLSGARSTIISFPAHLPHSKPTPP